MSKIQIRTPSIIERAPTVAELERAHAFFAWAVVNNGAVYLPLLYRVERELHLARQAVEGVAHAQSVLNSYAGSSLLNGLGR